MAKKLIFVSHCSKDADITPQVFVQLNTLEQLLPVKLWLDKSDIRAGDEWGREIEEALNEASVAVMLVSPKFLTSKFISAYEIPELRKRREKSGLRIIPIQLKPGAWPGWIEQTEMRPRGEESLFEILKNKGEAQFERSLATIIDEIRDMLEAEEGGGMLLPERRKHAPSVRLLCDSLLHGMPDATDFARGIAGEIGRISGLSGEAVFDATRLFIEYHLLESQDANDPAALELAEARGGKPPKPLIALLKQFGRDTNASQVSLPVYSKFFHCTLEREGLWRGYFDAVAEIAGVQKASLASFLQLRIRMGYLAAQFLLAGMLARFDDDWRPLLNAYQSAIPKPKERSSAFESLQASQWNCWLMWGPSVPICQCDQWRGVFAYQYGYGDENNSLPVVELKDGADGMLDALGRQLRVERRGAKFTELTARLRWGPYFLGQYAPEKPAAPEFDLAARDRAPDDDAPAVAKHGAAVAQAALYRDDGPGGLVLQLDAAPRPELETRVYFSAYYWLMFLVAVPPKPGRAQAGPGLLRSQDYPPWEEREQELVRAKLWQDLLPVFVHANIGDPEAFRFQRQALVQNALQLLRDLWSRRTELFDAQDVEAGIQFHLVCASDYSGCGCDIRYAPEDSLVKQLRARLEAEPDRQFAAAVVLPADKETPETRPWGLAGYFSACHLPELVAGYYEHVAKVASN